MGCRSLTGAVQGLGGKGGAASPFASRYFGGAEAAIDRQAKQPHGVGGEQRAARLEGLFGAYSAGLPDQGGAVQADMALSGTFDQYLGQLRTLLLVEGSRPALRANPELFS